MTYLVRRWRLWRLRRLRARLAYHEAGGDRGIRVRSRAIEEYKARIAWHEALLPPDLPHCRVRD